MAPRAAALACTSACVSACGAPAFSCQPSPTTRSPCASTQPTRGLGVAVYKPLLRERQRAAHHRVVERRESGHFRRFLVFTSCTASRKSSGDSKLRYTEAKRM